MERSGTADYDSTVHSPPALAETILQQLAPRFHHQCQERWVGTITSSFRGEHHHQKEQSEPVCSWPGQPQNPVNTFSHITEHITTDEITLMLRPLSLGDKGSERPMAQVVRTFALKMRHHTTSQTWFKCGPFGVDQPDPMRQADREQSHLIVERGEAATEERVNILLDRESGRYTIEVRYPSVVKKKGEERRDTNPGNRCQPVPSSTSSDGEEQPLKATLFIKVSGQIDPNQPDVLTGSEVSGTLEAEQTVKKWHLRLVRSKKTQ